MKADYPNFEHDSAQMSQLELDESKPIEKSNRVWKQPFTYLALIVFGGGMAILGDRLITPSSSMAVTPPPPLTSAPIAPAPSNPPTSSVDANFVTTVVDQVGPAVVRIDATRTVKNPVPDAFQDPFFRQFFGSNIPTPPGPKRTEGSGFRLYHQCQW
ncbi:hypothetical protein [Kovacikia minuta]|uniref:hypothetical protein n=1 Tax=Kovacikia minuta TaxID=2931930 RepID=UPI002675DAA1